MRILNCLNCIRFSKRNVLFSHLILFQCSSVSLIKYSKENEKYSNLLCGVNFRTDLQIENYRDAF